MVPADADDIMGQYNILARELEQFNPQLADKPRVLAISKSDMLDDELIAEIEQTLAHAQIIDDDDISTEKVGIGTTVKILDMEMDEEMEFKMVGTKEADISSGKMSDESPIGSAILDHEVGDEVEVETPSGVIGFKILEIRKDDED